jgi:MFS family permease
MPRPLGAVVVSVAAAVVLVLELIAMRLAAPYVGLTLDTYSAAIGVALLGIACGAWLGGTLADRVDPRRTLGPTLIAGGALVFLARPVVDWLGPELQGSGPKGAIALVGVATGPAILVLSMAQPAVVKLLLGRLERAGSTVGALSALGTLGALGGTFATGFVLLGEFSTREIALGAGLLVVALGVVVSIVLGRPAAVAAALLAIPGAGVLLSSDGVCDLETRYYCAQVVQSGEAKLLVLDDLYHAQVDPVRPEVLGLEYLQRFSDVAATVRPDRQPIRALHLGGGGFAFPRYLRARRPGTRSTVLELDPGVVEIGRIELGLQTREDIRVRVGDARVNIIDEPSGAYDLVAGDAFASRSVPWHLTTREFLVEVERVLRADGVYVLNLIDAGELRFLEAELATLRDVFSHVALLAADGQGGGNFVAAASTRPLDLDAMRRATQGAYAVRTIDPGGAPILTDDRAPVDQLMSRYAATAR